MNRINMNDGHSRYERISKPVARKRFDKGEPVYVIAAKMRPGRPFSMGMSTVGHAEEYREQYGDEAFSRMLINFTWYNCTWETGYYPAFYIETPIEAPAEKEVTCG